MNSNKLILMTVGIIAGFLLKDKINNVNILLFSGILISGCIITKDCLFSLSVSLIITYVLTYLNDNSVIQVEKFKNSSKKSKKKKSKKKKNRKQNLKQETFGLYNDDVNESFETDSNDDAPVFNSKESFLENYKTLSKSQLKGLNKDTRELIETQKNLINTLNQMGPALKEGKGILDTFKNYFGSDSDIAGDLGIDISKFKTK